MRVLAFHSPADATAAAAAVIAHLRQGGIIAYPTETVYGFGSLLLAPALRRLADLKGREENRAFLLVSDDTKKLVSLQWSKAAKILGTKFWPGPLTIAVRAAAGAPYPAPVLTPQGTVAVRITPLATLRRLIHELGAPITSTSANLTGSPPASDVDELRQTLRAAGSSDVLVLDGGVLRAQQPSTIVDCSGAKPRLIRAGAVPTDALREALATGGFDLDV